MRIDENIHVLSITDSRNVQHLAVTICSLLINKAPESRVCLHVLHDDLTRVNQMRLELIAEQYGAEIRFHRWEEMTDLHAGDVNPDLKAAYRKLSIPSLPSLLSVSRAIYLDSDIVVTGDISTLWATDLAGRVIGAVRDFRGAGRRKELNLPAGWPYFNAGVLLIDMDQWRGRGITEKAWAFIRRYPDKLLHHDQDALNAVLQAEWLELPVGWNCHTDRITRKQAMAGLPAIIHFAGESKPWHYDNDHPFQGEYYRYLRMTGWRSYEPEKNRSLVMKRFRKRLKKQLFPTAAYSWLTKLKSMLTEKADRKEWF
ncbi:glycosyltransferase family 8 protein [Cohnella pontilimi]|uniref:Glycosyltransferase family 8 protein n=1 Tax=Cohnella pontilimi TaxID=2564100 RepID=A0A4U0FH62_9BACL|nr:glycosyltransferase family 8 protein [Cohnella pontilimi]TJY42742.1 glycosyltransferase family 8 protein [Cohnella pontilimi]